MHQADLFLVFTAPLDSAGLEYIVSGSVASMVYGEPRLTNDIDIVLHLDHRRAAEISMMYPLSEFYCPPVEVIVIEARRSIRGHFNIIHLETGHKADIYVHGEDPLESWGLEHRRCIEVAGGNLWIAPPEYVILRKLEYFHEGGSAKHKLDIEGMLAVSGDAFDLEFLQKWAERLGVQEEWASIAAE